MRVLVENWASAVIAAWAAPIGTLALVDEIDRLNRQAEQLRDLLSRNGIDGTLTS